MKVVENITIKKSAPAIFAYLMDVNNRSEYIPALEEVVMLDPLPIRKGSRYIEVAKIGGRRLETTYIVTQLEPNRYLKAKTLKSVFPIEVSMVLTPTHAQTQLTIDLNFRLKGIFQLASGIVQGIVRDQARNILQKIKYNIETDKQL